MKALGRIHENSGGNDQHSTATEYCILATLSVAKTDDLVGSMGDLHPQVKDERQPEHFPTGVTCR